MVAAKLWQEQCQILTSSKNYFITGVGNKFST